MPTNLNHHQRQLLGSLREIVFGLEDGMVSTLGVITGIASGTSDRFIVLLSGLVVICVESLSMAAGTYLSNKSEEEALSKMAKNAVHARLHLRAMANLPRAATFMGISYVFGGLIPILPYLFVDVDLGIFLSVGGTVLGLLIVGAWKAKVTGTNIVRSALEMATMSLSAALIGFLVGKLATRLFPQLHGQV